MQGGRAVLYWVNDAPRPPRNRHIPARGNLVFRGAHPHPVRLERRVPAGAQTPKQREVEARIKALGSELARHQGLTRRRFFKTAAGMAAAFVAMNDVYGPLFTVSSAEAASPDMANDRARALADQFIMDLHTHFLRDDTRIMGFVRQREAVGKAGWNPALAGKPQTIEDLKFANYFKEIYLDSDTKVALISGSGSEEPRDWFLTNEMKYDARAKVNRFAGSRRMMSHAIFMPGMPDGWTRSTATSRCSSPIPSRATPWATTPTRTSRATRGASTTRSCCIRSTRSWLKAGLVNVCVHKGSIRPRPARSTRTCCPTRRARRGQGGEGLAAAQLHRLPLGVPLYRRRLPDRHGAVREDRAHRLGDRPRRDPGEIRRDQRLRRPRADLRPEHRWPSRCCAR
jgi:hypothetical protein